MPATLTPDFAVIIPHYNDPERLMRCLLALESQNRDGVEVVVVDNASPVDMRDTAARFDWLRVLIEPAKGAAAARNCGVVATRAPWLFFLDADCVPAPDWLDRARALTRQDPRRVTGGAVDVFDETPPPRSGAEAFETVFAFDQQTYITRKNFSVTANLVVARAVFEAVGPFTLGVSEDYNWCQRAVEIGYPLHYAPDLQVVHPTRSDWYALRRKWQRLTTESYGLIRDGGLRSKLGWILRALAMPASGIAHLPRVLRHPDLSALERVRAAVTLLRLRCMRMIWMLACLRRQT